MSYFGLILLAWLFTGFITGLKVAWADDRLNDDEVKKKREIIEKQENEQVLHLYDVFTLKKRNFIALCTLLGFFVAILEVKGMVRRFKNLFSKDKKEAK